MLIDENIYSRHLVIKRTLSTDAFLRNIPNCPLPLCADYVCNSTVIIDV